MTLAGKATVDADEQRLRGKFALGVEPTGDVVLEFVSSFLFGSQREDFAFSVVGDTVRVIDRERGEYFEGEEAEAFLAQALDVEVGIRETLHFALGGRPSCGDIEAIRMDRSSDVIRFDGKTDSRPFRVEFDAQTMRLRRVAWPVRLEHRSGDRLDVSYQWDRAPDGRPQLKQIVMTLEKRPWRCKLDSVKG